VIHHRDWERALMYLDPVGLLAVKNADRKDRGSE